MGRSGGNYFKSFRGLVVYADRNFDLAFSKWFQGGETGRTPKAGAIISFAGGAHGIPAAYGHVAFVEKVYPDGSFLISETNYNGNPNYTFRKLSGVDSTISFAYTTK
ncbi:CHAP domain-containing protein [Streptococcus equi subsp. zooepidemicus]|nr:CHAP domain-containing protein [Streptococcus equi subsp. zooepidemicus]MBR7753849.1 CHAP domain-containing protein [Streptococcus equi subsp. zooepidemicus]MBR7776841.1 CHAP domain-containing protein [Streptococcus equi subsp. zooepidemicus]MCD3402905.1 CHAP domain-containing protein [Streptococcus equi subsp. zooepidemicus]MCD3441651.1 CHAP domain-containing protein [Streptococcus equi subsp. zooepidemicus]